MVNGTNVFTIIIKFNEFIDNLLWKISNMWIYEWTICDIGFFLLMGKFISFTHKGTLLIREDVQKGVHSVYLEKP